MFRGNPAHTQSGQIVARFLTDAAARKLPALLDRNGDLDINQFYAEPTLDGVMVGLERIYGLGSIVGSPVLANGVLYVGSTDGTLYAIA
jgi:outer membrane protein assembly factor BamB